LKKKLDDNNTKYEEKLMAINNTLKLERSSSSSLSSSLLSLEQENRILKMTLENVNKYIDNLEQDHYNNNDNDDNYDDDTNTNTNINTIDSINNDTNNYYHYNDKKMILSSSSSLPIEVTFDDYPNDHYIDNLSSSLSSLSLSLYNMTILNTITHHILYEEGLLRYYH
jgi:hypothetical protein